MSGTRIRRKLSSSSEALGKELIETLRSNSPRPLKQSKGDETSSPSPSPTITSHPPFVDDLSLNAYAMDNFDFEPVASEINFTESFESDPDDGELCVSCLLAASASTKAVDDQNSTALHWAAYNGDAETLELLLQHGAEYTIRNNHNLTPIELAAIFKYWNCVEILINYDESAKRGANQDHIGFALLRAVKAKQVNTARILLEAGAPIDVKDDEKDAVTGEDTEHSLLHLAVLNGSEEMTELLLDFNASFNELNRQHLTPWDLAFVLKRMACREVIESAAMKFRFKTLMKKLQDYFLDPINLSNPLQNPVITPSGNTYSRNTFNDFKLDLANRLAVNTADLLENKIIVQLQAHYNQAEAGIDLAEMPHCLRCPISKRIFLNPVMAADGETYEEVEVEKYLRENNNILPTGVLQCIPLYPNLLVKKFVDDNFSYLRDAETRFKHNILKGNSAEELKLNFAQGRLFGGPVPIVGPKAFPNPFIVPEASGLRIRF